MSKSQRSTYKSHETKSLILDRLAAGNFVSGDELGTELAMSRMAISKHIVQLRALGVEIFSVKGKGYRLDEPLTLLNKAMILSHYPRLNKYPLLLAPIVDSTNDIVKHHMSELANGTSVAAECQLQGRGRQGRSWISPYASSLSTSTYWCFTAGYQAISGLSLAVGVAVIRTLQTFKVNDISVKWPNDVYIRKKKVAGVLIEIEGQFDSDCHCIIGVGINVNLPADTSGITQAWTDIQHEINHRVDRNYLLACYLNHLMTVLEQFSKDGLSGFIDEWNQYNLYQNKSVTLQLGTGSVRGVCLGIDDQGALLMNVEGVVKRYHGGEIRIEH